MFDYPSAEAIEHCQYGAGGGLMDQGFCKVYGSGAYGPINNRTYAVEGLGEASPPQNLPFVADSGGFAAGVSHKIRFLERLYPSNPRAKRATA